MFTGLVEGVGVIRQLEPSNPSQPDGGLRVSLSAPAEILADLKLGDSIALDGACMTVVSLESGTLEKHPLESDAPGNKALAADGFSVEVSPESLSKTIMGAYKVGRRVNLERPLLPSSRLGGHFVSGHVDCTASVLACFESGNSHIYRFALKDPTQAGYLVEKGSVTINGISLTVNTVDHHVFTVCIIPHTLSVTTIGDYTPDSEVYDTVNIETDILGKYVHRLLTVQGDASMLKSGSESENSQPGSQSSKTRLFAGDWFCHDKAIHGEYPT